MYFCSSASRISMICGSTWRPTMKEQLTTAQWRAVVTLLAWLTPWNSTIKEYTRSTSRGRHKLTCQTFLPFLMPVFICGLLFLFQEGNMVSRYKCHLCDKNFSWCYTLTLHLRKKHQLKWPSGHSRFRYAAHDCGLPQLFLYCVVFKENLWRLSYINSLLIKVQISN